LIADWIIPAAIGVLVSQGLAVGRVESDVLGCRFEGSAETEQTAIGTPASTFLGFFTEIA
jgi:hypothetical protein